MFPLSRIVIITKLCKQTVEVERLPRTRSPRNLMSSTSGTALFQDYQICYLQRRLFYVPYKWYWDLLIACDHKLRSVISSRNKNNNIDLQPLLQTCGFPFENLIRLFEILKSNLCESTSHWLHITVAFQFWSPLRGARFLSLISPRSYAFCVLNNLGFFSHRG